MATNEEVLAAVTNLTEKLYGKDGFKGDIVEIKEQVKETNGHTRRNKEHVDILDTTVFGKSGDPGLVGQISSNRKCSQRNLIILCCLVGSLGLGYGIPELIKLFM